MYFQFGGVLAVGADLGTVPCRWALGSGEVERVAMWCPGWGGPGRRRCLLPAAGPGQGLFCAPRALAWEEEDAGALWPHAASLPAACCY